MLFVPVYIGVVDGVMVLLRVPISIPRIFTGILFGTALWVLLQAEMVRRWEALEHKDLLVAERTGWPVRFDYFTRNRQRQRLFSLAGRNGRRGPWVQLLTAGSPFGEHEGPAGRVLLEPDLLARSSSLEPSRRSLEVAVGNCWELPGGESTGEEREAQQDHR